VVCFNTGDWRIVEAKFLRVSEEGLEDAGGGAGCFGCLEDSATLRGCVDAKCRRGIMVVKASGAMG
jgi:hypothetical protein